MPGVVPGLHLGVAGTRRLRMARNAGPRDFASIQKSGTVTPEPQADRPSLRRSPSSAASRPRGTSIVRRLCCRFCNGSPPSTPRERRARGPRFELISSREDASLGARFLRSASGSMEARPQDPQVPANSAPSGRRVRGRPSRHLLLGPPAQENCRQCPVMRSGCAPFTGLSVGLAGSPAVTGCWRRERRLPKVPDNDCQKFPVTSGKCSRDKRRLPRQPAIRWAKGA
jgi:hypothetical protein